MNQERRSFRILSDAEMSFRFNRNVSSGEFSESV